MKLRIITRVVPDEYTTLVVVFVVQREEVVDSDIDFGDSLEWMDKGEHETLPAAEDHVRLLQTFHDKVVKTYG